MLTPAARPWWPRSEPAAARARVEPDHQHAAGRGGLPLPPARLRRDDPGRRRRRRTDGRRPGRRTGAAAEALIAVLRVVHSRTRNPASDRAGRRRSCWTCSTGYPAPQLPDRRAVPGHRHQQPRRRTAVGRRPRRGRNQPAAVQTRMPAELGLGLTELSAQAHLALLDVIHGRLPDAHRRGRCRAEIAANRRGWASEPQALGAVRRAGDDPPGVEPTRRGRRPASTPAWPSATAARTSPADWPWPSPPSGSRSPGATRPRPAPPRPGWRRSTAQAGDTPADAGRWCAVAHADAHLAAGEPEAAIDLRRRRRRASRVHRRPGTRRAGQGPTDARPARRRARPARRRCRRPLLPYRGPVVEARILAAVAADRIHRDTAALAAITEAIDLAQGVGIIRPFLAAGPRIAALLARHRHVVARHLDFTRDTDRRRPTATPHPTARTAPGRTH